MGRPTKLTPEALLKVCEGLRYGLPLKTAAHCAGLSYSTLRRGVQDNPDWREAVAVAESLAVARAVGTVNAAAEDGTWQAAAWWLERRHPEEFGSDRRLIRQLERTLNDLTNKVRELEREKAAARPAVVVNRVAGLLPKTAN